MPLQMDTCEEANEAICMQYCTDEWNGIANNGDLTSELDNGYTLGQDICLQSLEHFIPFLEDNFGYLNARLCEGNWETTGLQTRQAICCDFGHYYECGTNES